MDLFVLTILVRIDARSVLRKGGSMVNATFDLTAKVLIPKQSGLSRIDCAHMYK